MFHFQQLDSLGSCLSFLQRNGMQCVLIHGNERPKPRDLPIDLQVRFCLLKVIHTCFVRFIKLVSLKSLSWELKSAHFFFFVSCGYVMILLFYEWQLTNSYWAAPSTTIQLLNSAIFCWPSFGKNTYYLDVYSTFTSVPSIWPNYLL